MNARQVLARSQRVRMAYRRLIQLRDRLDDPRIRHARGLVEAIRTAPPRVLYLGDSAASFIGPHDVDRRPLHRMISDGLADQGPVLGIHGGGYHPGLFTAYLKLLRGSDARPLVIHPLCLRVRQMPWVVHPAWGYASAEAYLRALDPATAPSKIRARAPRQSAKDMESLYALPFPTLIGDLTVGDYVRPQRAARSSGKQSEDLVRLLYAYHHGGRLEPGTPAVESITELAQTLSDLGCPVVTYETPVPVERGVQLFGEDFAALTRHNFDVFNAAYRAGASADTVMIGCGMDFADREFIYPDDASEHLNDEGRQRLAEMIVSAARTALIR